MENRISSIRTHATKSKSMNRIVIPLFPGYRPPKKSPSLQLSTSTPIAPTCISTESEQETIEFEDNVKPTIQDLYDQHAANDVTQCTPQSTTTSWSDLTTIHHHDHFRSDSLSDDFSLSDDDEATIGNLQDSSSETSQDMETSEYSTNSPMNITRHKGKSRSVTDLKSIRSALQIPPTPPRHPCKLKMMRSDSLSPMSLPSISPMVDPLPPLHAKAYSLPAVTMMDQMDISRIQRIRRNSMTLQQSDTANLDICCVLDVDDDDDDEEEEDDQNGKDGQEMKENGDVEETNGDFLSNFEWNVVEKVLLGMAADALIMSYIEQQQKQQLKSKQSMYHTQRDSQSEMDGFLWFQFFSVKH